jgi:pimeloyl-ACP methyl ester carboxylesterase
MSRLRFIASTPTQPDLPWLIYLPGMDGTGQLFNTQAVHLESAFNLRCLALPSDYLRTWDQMVEEVLALIELEQPCQPLYLCGESFGGCFALKLARRAPDLFERIVLVNPASSFRHRSWLGWGVFLLPWIHDYLYQSSAVTFLPWLAAVDRVAPSDRMALLTAMQSVPQATSAWRLLLLRQFQVENLDRFHQPVLLIASGSDRLLPSVTEAAYLKQQLPQAQTVILPESGHACLLEQEVNLYQIFEQHDFLPQPQSALAAPLQAQERSKSSV